MTPSEAQTTTPAAAVLPATAANEYPMSREGRRQAYILLVGVVSLFVFAVWTLVTLLDGGLEGAEWVSALLMLGIIVVAPLVAWTLLEEANSRITETEGGLRYTSLGGVGITYPWAELAGFKEEEGRGRVARFFLGDKEKIDTKNQSAALDATDATESEEESEDEPEPLALCVRDAYRSQIAGQISNPLVRFLHTQAHGAALPIYGRLQNRAELLAQITSHMETNE